MENFNNLIGQIRKPEETILTSQKIIQEAESIEIKENDRNKDGLLLTADGNVSHYQNKLYWKILKTDSFKKWFNNSVTVYEDNKEPLIVFHSTLKRKITGLNLKLNKDTDDWNSYGVYFSSNQQATVDFYNTQYKDDIERFKKLLSEESEEKEAILLDKEKYINENDGQVKTFAAFIKIEKPLELDGHEKLMELSWAGFSRDDLLKEHDGVVINNDSEFSDQYIVFKTENILHLPSELK